MGLDPRMAVRVLAEAVNVYARAGVPVWMQDGTLLGAVREGRTIEWDDDMDLGLMHEDWSPEADAALQAAGFRLLNAHNRPESDYHQNWKKGSVMFCAFHYYREPDGRVWHGVRNNRYRYFYPQEFEIRPYPLSGVLLPAPYPPEAFLETKYGPDWRTPNPSWNHFSDPTNAKELGG